MSYKTFEDIHVRYLFLGRKIYNLSWKKLQLCPIMHKGHSKQFWLFNVNLNNLQYTAVISN